MLKKYWLSWKEYFPLPKLHQVLAIRSTLGAAFGGEGAQNAFRLGGENTLRGYPKGSLKGQYVGVISVEYRFPLRNEERGWGTFPFFLHRSHGSIFCDLGGAFREIDLSYVKVGVGGSVGVDATFLYHKPIRLSFSAARGLSKDGEFQFWIQAEGGL
jgi:outer membrane protein insertion porin family